MLDCADKADASTHSASEQLVNEELVVGETTDGPAPEFEIEASDRIGTGVKDVTIVEAGVATPARQSA